MEAKRVPVRIEEEMRRSYLDYSMSVIVGRALPDARDGLKPVHRRVLFSMYEQRNVWNRAYRKSARIVGDVIGKYHPHGEASVYDTIVRLAQDFSMRYPLVDGQGNFGSLDGDPAAAMRYTEIRMERIASELLEDIEKETVEFRPNYDESIQEPIVLPTKIPQLLLNGSSGIAVGMATNMPPHNLGEVVDGLNALIQNPDITLEELMAFIPGPDFPTHGIIYGKRGIRDAYATGKGIIRVRGRSLIERNAKTERESIVFTEIPFTVNKAKLVEKIAELVHERKIEGIHDLRDESDKDGIRIVVELKRDVQAEVLVRQIYKHTPMEMSFGVINLALVNQQPRVLSLKELMEHFLNFRKGVVTRRCMFDLKKAEERAHILEGLRIALDHLDEVIALIRASYKTEHARSQLMERFSLSAAQAQAILEMRLQRLTGLEREKIVGEYGDLIKEIARLREILSNERLIYRIIQEELEAVKTQYSDARRTEIREETDEIEAEDLIVEEDMVVTISNTGYIKRNPVSLYRAQLRGGKGKTGMGTKEDDFVTKLFVASTHSYLLVFTSEGRVYWLKVHEIPQAGRMSKGRPIVNMVNLLESETIRASLAVRVFQENQFIVMATKKGIIKKSPLSDYSRPRAGGIIAVRLDPGDHLVSVEVTDGEKDIVMLSRHGILIRFSEKGVRDMGRVTRGVTGIRLRTGDEVVGMEVVDPGATLLTVTENGYGKRTRTEEYRVQARGGQGLITIKTDARNGMVVGMKQVTDDDELMIISNTGKIIRIKASGVPVIGRNTKGVRLIVLEEGEKVVSMAKLEDKEYSQE
ncbi:MAG: DNA gyrase subunit A [bacterium]